MHSAMPGFLKTYSQSRGIYGQFVIMLGEELKSSAAWDAPTLTCVSEKSRSFVAISCFEFVGPPWRLCSHTFHRSIGSTQQVTPTNSRDVNLPQTQSWFSAFTAFTEDLWTIRQQVDLYAQVLVDRRLPITILTSHCMSIKYLQYIWETIYKIHRQRFVVFPFITGTL